MTADRITIRRLQAEDWQLYSRLRLQALLTDAGVFSSTYAKEVLYTPADWQARLSRGDRAVFALFDGDAPVGLTVAAADETDPAVAVFYASWIDPRYRGRGLSDLFYTARLAWARDRGMTSARVSHRAGNAASRRANARHGFTPTHRAPRQWPDGATEDEVFYQRML